MKGKRTINTFQIGGYALIQIKNGFKDYYYINESDYKIYNTKTKKFLTLDTNGSYTLTKENGKVKHISNNTILKLVFGSGFILKDIDYLPHEQWKQINNSNYFISNLGRVKSNLLLESKLLIPDCSIGYARVKIDIGYGTKNYLVHKLVAEYFLEPPTKAFMEIHHINNDKLDNQAENLIFLTHEEHCKIHKELRRKEKQ